MHPNQPQQPYNPYGAHNPFLSPVKPQAAKKQTKHEPFEKGLKRYVNYLADYSGCGFWRILWPELLINQTGLGCSTSLTSMVLDPKWYKDLTCIKFQRQASDNQKQFIQMLRHMRDKENMKFKMIYEVDDVVFREEIPDYNKFKFAFDNNNIRQNCIDIINMCDEVTVTCPYMRDLYKEKTGKEEITVIPNFVPDTWLGRVFNQNKVYSSYDKNRKRPRVLYTGSGAHYDVDNKNGGIDDFSHVVDMVERTLDKYQWVFMGAFPPKLTKYVKSGKIEFHKWQTLTNYPDMLASLEATIMIAPLLDNSFNRSKSDIKFIEACTLGIPCMVQDMETYKNAPDFLKFKAGDDLEVKIDAIIKNKPQYYKNVTNFRRIAELRFLERPENIGAHLEALNTPYGSTQRKYLQKWN
jgi:hypothetical protein